MHFRLSMHMSPKIFHKEKKIDFYFFPCYFVYKLKKEGRRHDKQQLCIGMLLLYGAKKQHTDLSCLLIVPSSG